MCGVVNMIIGIESEFDVGERFGGSEDCPVDGGKRRDLTRPSIAFFGNYIKLLNHTVSLGEGGSMNYCGMYLPVGHKS